MLICNDCGEIFDDDELESRSECVGEFWGSPAYQDYDVCPYCGSDDFEEYIDPDETDEDIEEEVEEAENEDEDRENDDDE